MRTPRLDVAKALGFNDKTTMVQTLTKEPLKRTGDPGAGVGIVLASASPGRAALLKAAGIAHTVVAARVDEDAIKQDLTRRGAAPGDIAQALADQKAAEVSRLYPADYVIGADQMLVCDGKRIDKPADMDSARNQLMTLRGRRHELLSAVSLAHNGRVTWRYLNRSGLTMRDFSDRFLDLYLTTVGEAALASAGGYQIEGPGAQLFEAMEGDYYSIIGLPLLPVLEVLRSHDMVLS